MAARRRAAQGDHRAGQGAYTPLDVARVAAGTHRCAAGAAIALAAWHRAGCHPSADEVVLLDRLGVDQWYEPARAAIDWLWAGSAAVRRPTRTQVGLLLAVPAPGRRRP